MDNKTKKDKNELLDCQLSEKLNFLNSFNRQLRSFAEFPDLSQNYNVNNLPTDYIQKILNIFENRLSSKKECSENLGKDITELSNKHIKIKEEIEFKTIEKREKQAFVEDLQKSLEESNSTLKQNQEILSKEKEDLMNKSKSLSEAKAFNQKFEDEVNELKIQISQIRREHDNQNMKEKIKELENVIEILISSNMNMKEENIENQRKTEEAKKEVLKLNKQLSDIENEHIKIEENLSIIKKDSEDKKSLLNQLKARKEEIYEIYKKKQEVENDLKKKHSFLFSKNKRLLSELSKKRKINHDVSVEHNDSPLSLNDTKEKSEQNESLSDIKIQSTELKSEKKIKVASRTRIQKPKMRKTDCPLNKTLNKLSDKKSKVKKLSTKKTAKEIVQSLNLPSISRKDINKKLNEKKLTGLMDVGTGKKKSVFDF